MITTNKELRQKVLAKEKLTEDEKKRMDDGVKPPDNLKKRLQRLITRIPAFMYLTDYREKTIKDIVTRLEPDLFQRVTGLTLKDFEQLVDAKVFNDSKMNDAVWRYRSFDEPSVRYGDFGEVPRAIGGWRLLRDERFARLYRGQTVADDYGIGFEGNRYESPDAAATANTGDPSIQWLGVLARDNQARNRNPQWRTVYLECAASGTH